MNPIDHDREARLQAAAEQAERLGLPTGADPALDRHRLVLRALCREPAAQLPADFARRVALRAEHGEERAGAEDWTMTALLGLLALAGLYYLQPSLLAVLRRIDLDLPSLPWPMLAATGFALAVAWAVDQGAARWFSQRH